jgi:hypothetical protein
MAPSEMGRDAEMVGPPSRNFVQSDDAVVALNKSEEDHVNAHHPGSAVSSRGVQREPYRAPSA